MGKKKKKNSGKSSASTPVQEGNLENVKNWSPLSEISKSDEKRQKSSQNFKSEKKNSYSVDQQFQAIVADFSTNLAQETADWPALVRDLEAMCAEGEQLKPLHFLAWASIFTQEVAAPFDIIDRALAMEGEKVDLYRIKAILSNRQGQTDIARACFSEIKQLGEFGTWDNEAVDCIGSGRALPVGSGIIVPSLDFGSLHHLAPPSSPQLINYNLLKSALELEPKNEHLMFEAALHAFILQNWQSSEKILNNLVTMRPEQNDARALWGFVLEKLGDFGAAKAKYREVLQIDSSHPLANVNLGILSSSEGNLIGAEYYFARAVQIAPEFPEALSQYARYLVHDDKNADRIIEMHKKALVFEPNVSEYHLHFCLSVLRIGDIDKLQSEWNLHKKYIQAFTRNEGARRMISRVLTGSKDPLQDVAIAEMLIENGFNRPAKSFIVKAWKRKYNVSDEKQREFLYHVGLKASSCDEHSIAKEAFEALQNKDSNLGALSIYIAMAQARLGENADALDRLESINDETGKLGVMKSNLYWDLGEPEKSLASLESEWRAYKPSFLVLYYGVKYALASGKPELAEVSLEKGKPLFSSSPGYWALMAEWQLEGNAPDTARDFLQENLYQQGEPFVPENENPPGIEFDYAEAFYLLGCTFVKLEDWDSWDSLYTWLQTQFPGNGEWEILEAEKTFILESAAAALEKITPTNRMLLARISRYRFLHELNREPESLEQKAQAEAIMSRGKMVYHPAGSLKDLLSGKSHPVKESV